MNEKELEGASTRRVIRQAEIVLNRELDVLYTDRRKDAVTIAALQTRVDLFDTEKETWESERRDLEGDVARAESMQRHYEKVTGVSAKFVIVSWIVSFIAIGYGVWVG